MQIIRGLGVPLGGLAVLLIAVAPAHAGDGSLSFIVKGNLTTGSRLFPNPNAADPITRSQSYEFKDFFGLGVEVKYQIPGSSIAIGLSTDYIKSTQSGSVLASGRKSIPTEDGFVVIPVELTGYFRIPVSDGPFAVFMGGGVGAYFGERRYSIAGYASNYEGGKPGYGIHVLGGVSYQFSGFFTLSAEMKFRDAQFESKNAFAESRVSYRDIIVAVSQTPFVSSLHVDGMVLQLGAAVSF
jgi:hypothetical protein